ncbi:ABC transporter ATP-binding protein [Galbitalea soli]|uniref:ATP-binding cassette domain-containing protein n=1 Tax=Galbitalea soli TaxID=1268042 RepID=A0A7C9PMT6_9MICO|nr:ATP-binding cassette domain-containing protein [Galbitalea soli]NEM91105.1 ATP-binding cassette domain-containing protein [Galbitalea soli]NYJ29793.1 branched-chain amino acid transport system ATP-binding protein [Galbitalea soli]
MNNAGLTVRALTVERSGFPIIRSLDLDVPLGRVTSLLGANGAGKTTLMEALAGLIPVSAGSVELDGTRIEKLGRARRVGAGLALVEQGRTVFGDLTVLENLTLGKDRSAWGRALAVFPELDQRKHVHARFLSGGEQQMVVLARAILADPQVLLIDEMSLGLAPVIIQRLMPLVRTLADAGMGVLLVEQFATQALAVSDHAVVLTRGEVAFRGAAQDLLDDSDRLRLAYLGESQTQNGTAA